MHARPALILSALLAAAAAVAADDPTGALPPGCDTFTWDVASELAALQQPGVAAVAGNGGDVETPRVEPGTRYEVRLHPQAGVEFVLTPGRDPDAGSMAGLLAFQVPEDGRYRVSLTTGHWVDVIDGGRVVASLDHQGQRGCPLLRKVVEFEFDGGRDLMLQLDGTAGNETGVLVTPAIP